MTTPMSSIELTRSLLPGDKEVCLELPAGIFWESDVGGDMFTRAVVINIKPGCDFPRALVHHAMDRVCCRESSPAGTRSFAVSPVLLSIREDP
jgi:hypothetical protein